MKRLFARSAATTCVAHRTFSRSRRLFCLGAACAGSLSAALFVVTDAAAQAPTTTPTWTGGSPDFDNWSDSRNWLNNLYPSGGGTDMIHFAGIARTTPNNDFSAYTTFNQILFDSGAGAFTLTGNAIKLAANGGNVAKIENNSTSLQTVSLGSIVFNGSGELDPTLGDLTVNNSIYVDGSGTQTINVYGNGHVLTLNATLNNGSAAAALAIQGTSTVTLNAANSYTGGTAINAAATLNVNNSTALGTGTLSLNAAGLMLNNTSGAAITLSTNNAVSFGNNFAFGGTNSLSFGTGVVSIGADRTVTLNGNNSNTLSFGTLQGTGTGGGGAFNLQVNNASGVSGETLVFNGFNMQAAGGTGAGSNFLISGSGNVTFNGAVTNGGASGNNSLQYTGTGTLKLAGTNTYSGTTSITGLGTINLSGTLGSGTGTAITAGTGVFTETGTGVIAGTSSLTASGGVVTLAGANTYSGTTILSAGTLNLNSAGALGSGTFSISNGTLDNTSGAAVTSQTNNPAITFGNNVTFGGSSSLNLGTGTVAISGDRVITLAGSNTNTLTFGGTLQGAGTGTGGAFNLTVNNVGGTAGETLVFNGFNMQAAGGTGAASNFLLSGTGNLTFTGAIANGGSGANSLTYQGSGLLTLAGANTYTGSTVESSGTVRLTGSLAGSNVSINAGTFVETSAGGISGTGTTFSMTGGGATATLGGTNTYTGATTVGQGANVITLNLTGSLSGSNVNVSGPGAVFTESTTGQIGGTGTTFTLNSGVATLAGTNNYTGATTLTANSTLNVNSAGALGSGTFIINGGTLDNTSGSAKTLTQNNAITLGGFSYSTTAGTASNSLNLGTGAVSSAGSYTVTLNGGGTLAFGGVVTNTTAAGQTLTVNNPTAGSTASLSLGGYALTGANDTALATVTINGSGKVSLGSVTNGTYAGSGLTYSGTGSLTLNGSNTYTGTTTLSSGSLNLTGSTNGSNFSVTGGSMTESTAGVIAGAANTFTANNGGTAILAGQNTYGGNTTFAGNGGTIVVSANSTSNAGTLVSGPVGIGTLKLNQGTFQVTGSAVTLGNTLTVGNDIAGIIAGNQNLTFAGNFVNTSNWTTLRLTNSGLTTFSGGVTMNGNKLTLQGSGSVTINSVFSGSNNFAWESTGTLTLSGNNTYTGPMALSAGTVTLDYTTNNTKKLSGSSFILGGTTLNLNGGSTAESVSGTTVAAGATTINQTGSGTSTIVLGGLSRNAGGTLSLGTGGIATTTAGTASTLLTDGSGVIGVIGGNDWAAKAATGNGIVGFSTVGIYASSTGTTVSSGNNTDVVGSVTLGAPGSTNTLRFNTAGATTITATGQTLNLTQGGILVTPAVGNNLTTITGGNLTASGALLVFQNNTGSGLTIDSNISSASNFTKAGAGLVTLTNTANSFTGKTFLTQGTVNIAADASLGTAPGAVTTDQLTFNGGTLQFGGSITLAANRGITLLGNGGTIDTNGNSGSVNGVIAGGTSNSNTGALTFTGGFTKAGAGTLVLNAANTYRGPTLVTGGTLNANVVGALGSGSGYASTGAAGTVSVTVNNGGTLLLTGAGNLDRVRNNAPIILGSGTSATPATFAVSSTGTGTANAVREGTGAQRTNSTTVTGASTVGLGALTLANNSTLDFSNTTGRGTLVFSTFDPTNGGTGSFVLNIANYVNSTNGATPTLSGVDGTDDRLIFNQDQSANLASFSFGGLGATEIALDAGFYEIVPSIVAVPEPATWFAGILAFAALGYSRRGSVRRWVGNALRQAA